MNSRSGIWKLIIGFVLLGLLVTLVGAWFVSRDSYDSYAAAQVTKGDTLIENKNHELQPSHVLLVSFETADGRRIHFAAPRARFAFGNWQKEYKVNYDSRNPERHKLVNANSMSDWLEFGFSMVLGIGLFFSLAIYFANRKNPVRTK
jgi:hypothetical protein